MLEEAVVVTEDRPRADIGFRSDHAVAQIGEVVGLGPGVHADVLDLDEIAHLDPLAQVRAGTQPGIGPHLGTGRDGGPLDVAETADARAPGDLGARPEHDIRLDRRPAAHLGVEREMHRLGRRHCHPGGEKGLALDGLEQGLRHRQFGLGVDPHDGVLIGENRAGRFAAPPGQFDHVGQIVFALGVVVAYLRQQLEQQGRRCRHDAGIAGRQRQHFRRRLLRFGNGRERVPVHNQPPVRARIARLEADDRDAVRHGEHRLDVGGLQQRHVAIGDDHLTGEALQRRLGAAHGVAGADGRVLHRDRGLAQPLHHMGPDLGRVIADHDDDPLAAERLGGVDGVIQHGAAADRVQHLGQGRLHPRALAGGENDGGPRT